MSYLIVTCRGCGHRWIVEDQPDASECHNCRRRQTLSATTTYGPFDNQDDARIHLSELNARGESGPTGFTTAADRD